MKKSKKSLLEQIEELKKALEASEKALKNGMEEKSAVQLEDQMKLADKYLTNESKAALSVMKNRLTVDYTELVGHARFIEDVEETAQYVQKVAACKYYACVVRRDRVEEGVQAISETINELSKMGAIHSCLTKVSSMTLVTKPFELDSCVVFCFVHIKPELAEVASKVRHHTLEGGVGENLHSLDIELPPGEFLAECQIPYDANCYDPNFIDASRLEYSRVFDEIKEFFKFLPENTKVLEYKKMPITDLSVTYQLRFSNPLLQRVKRVEIEYVREVALLKEGDRETLKQFNLPIGIRYMGVKDGSKDGKIEDLYPRLR